MDILTLISKVQEYVPIHIPVISEFLPITVFLVLVFSGISVVMYLRDNRPVAKFGQCHDEIVKCRDVVKQCHSDLIAYRGHVEMSTDLQMRNSLFEMKYVLDQFRISYPDIEIKEHNDAYLWFNFLSRIAIFSKHENLKEARSVLEDMGFEEEITDD